VKSLQKKKIAQIYYYDPQSDGIKVQSPQSASTSRRLTLVKLPTYPKIERHLWTSFYLIFHPSPQELVMLFMDVPARERGQM
jgi:hypothetical protein